MECLYLGIRTPYQTNETTAAAAVNLLETVSKELEVGVFKKQEQCPDQHAGRQQYVGAREVRDAKRHARLARVFLLARPR